MRASHSPVNYSDLSWYIGEIRKFPILSIAEERTLCDRWRDHHDISSARQLVNSHLRLVVKIALRYRGYDLPLEDLIGEGHVGLMRAVCRFDSQRGVRFSTYAIWWIRAAIQEYVLHNWSLVKMGTTSSQKKLFFNLRRMRGHLEQFDDGSLEPQHVDRIAGILRVPARDVSSMDERMSGRDLSLNAPIGAADDAEWQNRLADSADNQEIMLAEREEAAHRKSLLPAALRQLTTRERHIIAERRLRETPATLESLSSHYGISRERIRQIETRAITKLRHSICAAA